MPMRQMKENSENHLVIEPLLQSPKENPSQKPQKSSQKIKSTSELSPMDPKNRGRRRNGARRTDQVEVFMRTISRACMEVSKKAESSFSGPSLEEVKNIESPNGALRFPSSSKCMNFALRPGFGQVGTRCIVKANHFIAELPNKDLNHYDVTITPEVASRSVNRAIMGELIKVYREKELGKRLPAYDGRKSLYTAGQLPFDCKEFTIKLVDNQNSTSTGPKHEREYKVVIKFVVRINMHHLGQFLGGKRADAPQDAIQILDIVLRELSSKSYCPMGRSFFSPDIRKPQRLGEGLESWCGFYQSIRPTQMGLSLNIDMASAAFIKPLPVIEYVVQLLGKDVISRQLSDSDRIKIKKAFRGVKVEVTHGGNVRRKYRVSGITSQPTQELVFLLMTIRR